MCNLFVVMFLYDSEVGAACVEVSRPTTLRQGAAWLPAPAQRVRITNNKNVNVPLNKS